MRSLLYFRMFLVKLVESVFSPFSMNLKTETISFDKGISAQRKGEVLLDIFKRGAVRQCSGDGYTYSVRTEPAFDLGVFCVTKKELRAFFGFQ